MNVIKVENISKLYRLGQVGTGSIFHDVNRWWHGVRGKEDPYMRVGEENDRTKKGEGDYVWALKDINFEVAQGEVLGIIGRNGAGKSTLLKILSRTTAPTTGSIKVKGRIASLLEVGTGFHPELSGRDNIFMNGTILGMTRAEIKSKFDEIVEFAGVARYLDTPVKRYSSGMYVRLAFAVAAHLESEILIVDEVLAVGDAEFQKKCLGKMKDVSEKQGRTVLFVSHNVDAIKNLCERSLIFEKGEIVYNGDSKTAIENYLSSGKGISSYTNWANINIRPGNEFVQMLEVKVINEKDENKDIYYLSESVKISFKYKCLQFGVKYTHGINLYNQEGVHILSSHDIQKVSDSHTSNNEVCHISVAVPTELLAPSTYYVSFVLMGYSPFAIFFNYDSIVSFQLKEQIGEIGIRQYFKDRIPGLVRLDLKWENY
jgi:lipopolysaccharide transport system ATP-binding protein